jgi:heme oxygenase
MRGTLSLDDYTTYLVQLAWLYDALERQVAHGDALPGSAPLWDSRLNRVDAISADLAHLGIADWKHTTAPSSSMAAYIAHLDGLNLSRAWAFRSLAAKLGPRDSTAPVLRAAADAHIAAALPHIAGDYAGEHWLASFALLALEA